MSPSTVRRRIAAGTLAARKEPSGGRFRWLVCIPASSDEQPTAIEAEPESLGTDADADADADAGAAGERPAAVEAELAPPRNDGASARPAAAEADAKPLNDDGDASSDAETDTPGQRSLRDHTISALVASAVLVTALLVWLLPFARWDAVVVSVALLAAVVVLSEGSRAFVQWWRTRRSH